MLLFHLAQQSFALGLGELKVYSYLNQKSKAEIPIIGLGSLPLSELKVNLADLSEFERIGMDRPYFLSTLKFSVKRKRGGPVIEISSDKRINEPYLQFLIDIAWSNGQLYRAYTVLLDPPGYIKPVEKKKFIELR